MCVWAFFPSWMDFLFWRADSFPGIDSRFGAVVGAVARGARRSVAAVFLWGEQLRGNVWCACAAACNSRGALVSLLCACVCCVLVSVCLCVFSEANNYEGMYDVLAPLHATLEVEISTASIFAFFVCLSVYLWGLFLFCACFFFFAHHFWLTSGRSMHAEWGCVCAYVQSRFGGGDGMEPKVCQEPT